MNRLFFQTVAYPIFSMAIILLPPSGVSAQTDRIQMLEEVIRQTDNDSIRAESYNELASYIRNNDLKLAKTYRDSGYSIFERLGDLPGMAKTSYLNSIIAYTEGNYEQSIGFAQDHYNWSLEAQDSIRLSYAIGMLAKVNRETGNLALAMQYTIEGLELSNKINDVRDKGYYAAELANLYSSMKQWDEAQKYHALSYDVAMEIGYKIGAATSLRNLAENAINRGKHEEAKAYLLQAIRIDSTEGYKLGIARSHQKLGRLFLEQDSLDRSQSSYERSLNVLRGSDHNFDLAILYQQLARIALLKKQGAKGSEYLRMSESFGLGINSPQFKSDHAEISSILQEQEGRFKDAYFSMKARDAIKDSILTDEIANQIAGLNIQYESAEKEKKILELQYEDKLKQVRLSRQRAIIIGTITTLFALGILTRRIFKQKGTIAYALAQKELLIKEIHHRIKNNLQVVSSLLKLHSKSIDDTSAKNALREGQNRVQSMALIHQKLYQHDNNTGVGIKLYFEKLIESLFSSYNINSEKIRLQTSIEDIQLDVDSLVPLGLIVNELISNALKHAFHNKETGILKVVLREEGDELLLLVSDNGKGLGMETSEALKKSFGYRLINAFATRLKADLEIDSSNGTTIQLRIKEYKKVT